MNVYLDESWLLIALINLKSSELPRDLVNSLLFLEDLGFASILLAIEKLWIIFNINYIF